MTRKGWCIKCDKLQDKLIVEESFTSKGQRQFKLKCPGCGTETKMIRWGREKTLRFLKGEKVSGQQLEGAIVR